MFRYIAFVFDGNRPADVRDMGLLNAQMLGLKDFRAVLQCRGLYAYVAGEDEYSAVTYTLCGQEGAIFGTLLNHDSGDRANSFCKLNRLDEADSLAIVRSDGRSLVDSHWGSYVSIFRNPTICRTSVFRSPLGHLPCLITTFNGVRIIFSRVEDVLELERHRFTVNWDFVAKYMLTRLVMPQETGLNGVREVRCGECAHFDGDAISTQFYWDPVRVAKSHQVEDGTQAVVTLREATRKSVHGWASTHDRVLLDLSGGLDSSIVASCLANAPTHPTVIALNQFSQGADSDEREYARLAARRAGFKLIEHLRNPAVDFSKALTAAVSERPQTYFNRIEYGPVLADIASKYSATAILNGVRGDEAFHNIGAEATATDYVRRHGIGGELLEVLHNAAELDGLSVWRVLQGALRGALPRNRWDVVEETIKRHTLANVDIMNALRQEDLLPWEEPDAGLGPGKQKHLYGLTNPLPYYPALAQPGEPVSIYPLASQPLMEAVLAIPTYILTRGGWDRVTARRAFEHDVPKEIIFRRSKGGLEEHIVSQLRGNISFVRTLLIEGELVEHGLLDRKKVIEALSDRPSGIMKDLVRLWHYLAIEVWLQLWRTRTAFASAA